MASTKESIIDIQEKIGAIVSPRSHSTTKGLLSPRKKDVKKGFVDYTLYNQITKFDKLLLPIDIDSPSSISSPEIDEAPGRMGNFWF